MYAGAHLSQLSRGMVNTLLLNRGALFLQLDAVLVPVSAYSECRDAVRQLLHLLSQLGQLSRDGRYVFRDCDGHAILDALETA